MRANQQTILSTRANLRLLRESRHSERSPAVSAINIQLLTIHSVHD